MSYTAQQIQSMIETKRGMNFTYFLSRPEVMRFATPISIDGENVLTIDSATGTYKKFKLDGIILFKNNQPVYDTECEGYAYKYAYKLIKIFNERYCYE